MKSITAITATALAGLMLSGCAGTYTPPAYDASHSRAYNIAHAGGLVTGVKDTEVPKDKVEGITDTLSYGAASTAVGAMTTSAGLSGLSGGALGLLSWALAPDKQGARNSFVAWMPIKENPVDENITTENAKAFAKDAKRAVAKMIHQAIIDLPDNLPDNLLDDLPVEIAGPSARGTLLHHGLRLSYRLINPDWGCEPYDEDYPDPDHACFIVTMVFPPRVGTSPSFTKNPGADVYVFTSNHDFAYQRLELLGNDNSTMPEQRVLTTLSRALPDWLYMYRAPGKVKLSSGDKIPFPYILNDGEAELFVYPSPEQAQDGPL